MNTVTPRQREAIDLMKIEGHPDAVAKRMSISIRAVQRLLERAKVTYPIGRPSPRLGRRISLAAANAA